MPSSMTGSQWVLESGRGVLYLGGFSGSDPVAGPDTLAALVQAGELRFVYDSQGSMSLQQPEVSAWLQANCVADENAPVPEMLGFDQIMKMVAGGGGMPALPSGMVLPQMPGGGAPGTGGMPGGMPAAVPSFGSSTLYDCAPPSAQQQPS